MLKQPLTYRLRKGMAENDPMELQASRSKTTPNQRNSTAVPSRLSFKSSLASLFNFRKSRKDLKLQSLGQKGSDGHAGPPVSMRGAPPQTKLYNSTLRKQVVGSAFVPKPVGMREGGGLPPGGASLLEFFQVLDDLDSKLAEEQSSSSVTTEIPLNYGSRTQFGHLNPSENRHGSITGRQKNSYNETSNMSIYDILRPGTPRGGFRTFSPRTRTLYDMYRTREPRVSKEDYVPKNTFGSTSLCLDSRQRSASQVPGHFTARSLHFPGTARNKSGFILPTHQQSPKRTPLSSIIWNRSDSSEDRQNQKELLNETYPMDVDPDHPSMYPQHFQESTRYEFYHSQNVYPDVNFHTPLDNAMSSDPFENSENMPFYPSENTFARSFFSNTFGRSKEQRFRQNPFWGQPEAHSPWSDFRRKPFTSSDCDFEMTSMEADGVSTIQNHSVSSQQWESYFYSYRTNISRNQEELHPLHFGSETSTLENMEVSQDHGDQAPLHFDMPDVFSTTGSGYHIKSGGSECQLNSYPREVPINKEPYSFGMAQTPVSSFNTSLPQTSGDKRNPPSSNFQNPKVTLQKVIPSKPVSVPIRSYAEVTVTNNDSINYLPRPESQPSVMTTDMNNDKDLNESNLEKDKQLSKMDQMSMPDEIQRPVPQVVDSPRLPNAHSPLSQNSTKSNSFVFSAPSTVSSKRSPRVHPKKDNPRIYTSHRSKANELKRDKTWTENRKPSSAVSPPFRISSFPSPNQSCHQELTVNNEDISGTLQNKRWSSNRAGNPKVLSLEEPNREEQWITTPSSNSSESAVSQKSTYDSPALSGLPTSSLANDSFSDTLISPTTGLSRRSPSGPDPFLREREERERDSKNQNIQFVPSSSENQRNDSCRPLQGETMDAVQDASHSPLWDRRGKGKIRRHISYIESLSKRGSRPTPGRESHNLIGVNENNSKAPQPHPAYCTFPRKSASVLFSSRKSESRAVASSFTGGTLPVPIKTNTGDPREGPTSHRSSPCSSESDTEGSKVVAVLVPVVPETGEGLANGKTIKSTSVDKKTLPFLERAMSCPSGVPLASTGREERGKRLSSDTYASVITPRPWDRVVSPLERDSPFRDGSLTKRSQQNGCFPGRAETDSRAAAPGMGRRPLSNEDPFPFPSDMSGKESGKTVQKFKMTSTLSVSSDEANVKCLEVVSVYYTLPRQQSQKLSQFLQEFTQHIESLTEPPQVRTESLQDPVEDELKCSALEQSESPSPEDLTMQMSSAHRGHRLSQPAVNPTDLSLARSGASRAFLQRMASFEADASFRKGDSKPREIVSDHLLNDAQRGRERGEAVKSKTLQTSSVQRGKVATEENSEHRLHPSKSGDRGPSKLTTCSKGNIGNAPVVTRAGECAGSDIPSRATRRAGYVQEDDRASELQLGEVRGQTGTHFQKQTNTALCDLHSQVIALTPALHKLQLDQESSEPGTGSLQFEPREIPQRSQEVNRTGNQEAKRETQMLVWDPPLFPGGSHKNETNSEDQERGENRPSVKHRLAGVSKANRNFPAKVLSPRRHVATIFPQRQNSFDFSGFPLDMPECSPQSPELTPKSADSRNENRLCNDETDAEKSVRAFQVTVLSRENSMNLSSQRSNSISPPPQNEFRDISEPTPKYENSEEATKAQPMDGEPAAPATPTFNNLGAADFFDPPLPLEPTLEASIRLASYQQQQQRQASSLEWEPEPNPYRSKSLKSVRLHGYGLRKSQSPRIRERHFSENTSLDNALSRLTLRDEFPTRSGYNRRFKSFSELSSFDENESWTMYDKPDTGPRSATSISRPIDYGIFGKEQQLAFLENIKKSLTQGRLWKPSFLKNPGFLKDDVINPESPGESLSSNSPGNRVSEEALSPSTPLNIYEEDTADSDCDTDTTTDDEYYLDENDKESEL